MLWASTLLGRSVTGKGRFGISDKGQQVSSRVNACARAFPWNTWLRIGAAPVSTVAEPISGRPRFPGLLDLIGREDAG